MDSSLSNHTKSPTSDYNYGIVSKASGEGSAADSIKLKISTKLADGSRAITNHSIPLNHNNVPKVKESHKDSSSSKHSHKNDIIDKYKDPSLKLKDGHKSSSSEKVKENYKIKDEKHKSDKHRDEKRKEDRHKDSKHEKHKDDRHKIDKHKSDKHKEDKHKSGLSNSSSLSSSTTKPKESSSSSSSSKPKENHSHSSSHKDSKHKEGSSSSKIKDEIKHKEHKLSSSSIMKPKEGSNEMSNHEKIKENSKLKDSSLLSPKINSGEKIPSSKHSDGEKKISSSSGEKKEHKSEKKDREEKKTDGERHKNSEKHKDIKKHKEKENRDKLNEFNELKNKEMKIKVKEEVKDCSFSPLKSPSSEKHFSPVKVKAEPPSDDDLPLSDRKSHDKKKSEDKKVMKENLNNKHKEKRKKGLDDESDDEPLSSRVNKVKKIKLESKFDKKRKPDLIVDEPVKKKKKVTTSVKEEITSPKKGRAKKEDDNQDVWKWWEEEKYEGGVKWRSLEHKGPVFAPAYEPLPPGVPFYYDGKEMKLSPEAEEVATFYGKMLDHDYTTKDVFNKNFFKDWRKVMTPEEKEKITDLSKCNFSKINDYFKIKSEERKNMTKEEKAVIKKQNEEITKEYGFCIIDGHKEKIGNFKIEPPGLFRGRGEHPKMGMLKRRTMPQDVIINCGKGSNIPKAPEGHKWKEVRHDNTVTWLACWTENVQGQTKYVMLNASSKLKGEKDWQKYETARRLKSCVDTIRENYREDWRSKEMKIRQRAVALYFIDKLALRAGNEKEEGETADTVGCCSLRVEHIELSEQKGNLQYVVDFDFLGKDSIRYQNSVPVEKRVFKNLQLFMDNKQPEDDLFDRLNTAILNKHLNELMEGLTAKVFRTYNASKTLQEQLEELTKPDDTIPEKILSYNRANRAVAILCNHQRAVPKTFGKSMENLQAKINAKKEQVDECKNELEKLNKSLKKHHSEKEKILRDKKKKTLERLKDQLTKLEVQATDKEENKEIALGTSKLNYLDPRISVAWCKKWEVPIEKIYNRTQRDKFRWAIEMAGPDFKF